MADHGANGDSRAAAPRPRDVLGAPVLPPAAVTAATSRLRAGMARLTRASAPPPVRILEGLLGVLDLSALVALCRIGLPERLDGPLDPTSLADRCDVDPRRLLRLLSYAAARGWIRFDRRGRVRPTATIRFLRRDHPGGWRSWVEFMGGAEITAALGGLEHTLREGGDAFAAINGAAYFDWMITHPQRHAVFDAAMAAGGRAHGLVLAHALDWSGSRHVCDVGGGTGALLTTLLAAHGHLEGTVFDLPEVIDRAPSRPRLRAVGGDAFSDVPPGADTYLLVNVLHDWADDDALRLLAAVTVAMASGQHAAAPARVVVVEGEAHDRPRDDFATRSDLLMFALTAGGRERTRDEFADLATAAGLSLRRTRALASGDVAHVMTPR